MLFDYRFETYTIPFPGFSLQVRAATNFEAIVDTMFGGPSFEENHCPYGAALWPAAIALGETLCRRPELVRQKRVLELGAGLGLGGLVAQKLGADATASDFHPDMAELCAHNAALNELPLRYVALDWASDSHEERYDTIIGSDLLYDPTLTPLVLAASLRLLAPGGRCVFVDPQRGQLERFRTGLKEVGYQFTEHTQGAKFADQSAFCVVFLTEPR